MKKKPVLTTVGNICTALALLFFLQRMPVASGIALCLAYACIYYDTFIFTGIYQLGSAVVCYLSIIFLLTQLTEGIPYTAIAVAVVMPIGIVRTVFLDFFSHNRYLWMELVTYLIGLALYIFGNFYSGIGWQGWIFPLPAMLGTFYLMFGFIYDGIFLKRQSKREYNALPGVSAPGFSLPDSEGNIVNLSDYKGKNLLLVFVRGDWCPFCHMMLRTYQNHHEEFKRKNINLLVIGPDPIGVNREMAEKLGLDFKILSDENLEATKKYGLRITGHFAPHGKVYDEEKSIPLPASFLIDGDGVIRYVSRPDKIGSSISFEDILPVIEGLDKK